MDLSFLRGSGLGSVLTGIGSALNLPYTGISAPSVSPQQLQNSLAVSNSDTAWTPNSNNTYTNLEGQTINGSTGGVYQANSSSPTATGGGSTPSGGGNNNNSNPVLSDAQLAYQAAQNQYSNLTNQLKSEQNDLGTQKDSLLNQIGSMYDNTIQQAKDTLANNINTLNTAKGTVTTGYEGQKNEQARLLTDQERQNRQVARALGDLGSSFYEGLQSDATANTAKNITNFSNEEQSQLDQIANEITNENTTSTDKISSLNQLETQAKQDILNKYQSDYDNIENDLAATGMNTQQAYDTINNQMQSTLDNISYYMNQYKTDVLNTGSSNISQNDINNYLTQAKNSFGPMSTVNTSAGPIGNSTALGNAQNDIISMANSGMPTDTIIGQIQSQYGLDPNTIQGMMAQAGIGSNSSNSSLSNLFPVAS